MRLGLHWSEWFRDLLLRSVSLLWAQLLKPCLFSRVFGRHLEFLVISALRHCLCSKKPLVESLETFHWMEWLWVFVFQRNVWDWTASPVVCSSADKPFEPTDSSFALGLLQLPGLINSWSDITLGSEGDSRNLTPRFGLRVQIQADWADSTSSSLAQAPVNGSTDGPRVSN